MSQPEHEAIVNEIRSSQIPASPELRERVSRIAASTPPAPPRREWWPQRRLALVLVPAAVAVALAGALVAGLAGSGKKKSVVAAPRATPTVMSAAVHGAANKPVFAPATQDEVTHGNALQKVTSSGGAGAAGSIPAT